jgi:hypothetical protein
MATAFAGFSPRSSGLRPTASQRTGSRSRRAAEIGVYATVLEALAPDGRIRRTTGGASAARAACGTARSPADRPFTRSPEPFDRCPNGSRIATRSPLVSQLDCFAGAGRHEPRAASHRPEAAGGQPDQDTVAGDERRQPGSDDAGAARVKGNSLQCRAQVSTPRPCAQPGGVGQRCHDETRHAHLPRCRASTGRVVLQNTTATVIVSV